MRTYVRILASGCDRQTDFRWLARDFLRLSTLRARLDRDTRSTGCPLEIRLTFPSRAGVLVGVYDFKLRGMRENAEAGESCAPADVLAVLEEIDALRSRLRQPTELHVSAHVDVDTPGQWVIDHPLLHGAVHASDPTDALVLAAVELRRALGPNDPGQTHPRSRRVDRAEWEALAAQDGPTSEALSGAILALERAEAERDEAKAELGDWQLTRQGSAHATAPEREAARRRCQERSLKRLAKANVEGTARSWASDGFGAAEDYGLPMPALVLAVRTTPTGRDLSWRFDGGRRWLALDHRVSDGVSSDILVLVSTVIEPTPEATRSLRQLPLLVSGRTNTISHLRAYSEAISSLFAGGVSVDEQRGPVGGGWPLDLSSIDFLTGGEVTTTELDDWTKVADRDSFLAWGPHWELLWLGDAPERW
jgi:hypothetical protein